MPCIITHTSETISPVQREHLKAAFGRAIEDLPGKSEFWLCCLFDDKKPMYFGGTNDKPAAFIEVNAFATSEIPQQCWEKLSVDIQNAINSELGVPKNRMYVREIASPDWGWNGGNF